MQEKKTVPRPLVCDQLAADRKVFFRASAPMGDLSLNIDHVVIVSAPRRTVYSNPLAVIDCFGILSDAKIRRYFELGCEVKALGRGHIQRIKEQVRSKA